MKQHALIWISLLIASGLSNPERKKQILIPLTESDSYPCNIEEGNKYQSQKYQPNDSKLKTRTLTHVPLKAHRCKSNKPIDTPYVGTISIGPENEPVQVLFDTGSFTNWIGDYRFFNHNYDHLNSDTAETQDDRFIAKYDDESAVRGEIWSDKVNIAGLRVEKQYFGVTDEFKGYNDKYGFDGVIGMPASNKIVFEYHHRQEIKKPTLLYQLFLQGQIEQHAFGVFFARSKQGSQLTLGGFDDNIVRSQPQYYPLNSNIRDRNWSIRLYNVKIDGNSVIESKDALIDTGTSRIFVPIQDSKTFYAAIRNAREVKSGRYSIPCSHPVSVSFNFGNVDVDYEIDYRDMIAKQELSWLKARCIGVIMGTSELSETWHLG